MSLSAIARQWNAAGAAGRQWTQVAVRQVLMRPMNAALMALDGKVVGAAAWEPIVDGDTHRAVIARLSDPSRRTTPGPERRHLLSGIAVCGECGSVLATGSSGTLSQYRCRARKAGLCLVTGTHAGRSIAALDAYVRELAIRRLRKPDAALLLRADHTAERTVLLAGDSAQASLYDEQWQLYQQRVITPRELADGRAAISAERERIRGQLDALDAADAIAPFLADPEAAWEEAGILERRALVTGLMYLAVFPSRPGRPPGTPRGAQWFDDSSVDVRWVRRLPSDG
jgi:site-specific DNA recombinase